MIEEAVISRTLGAALRTGGDFAEVFVEDKRSSSALLDDGKVEELTSGRDRGAGIRVVVGDTTGFAHTADLSEPGLAAAAEAAAAAARGGGGGTRDGRRSPARRAPSPNVIEIYPGDVAKARKVELLTRADEAARQQGGAISQVSARYGDSRRRILVANSDGLLADDDQVQHPVRGVVRGHRRHRHADRARERRPHRRLRAVRPLRRRGAGRPRPPTGPSPSWRPAPRRQRPDARRHRLRRRRRAVPRGVRPRPRGRPRRQGRVGVRGPGRRAGGQSPLVTLVDDGTMAGEWGAFAIDDEGHPAQRNVLIEDGVLTDYMWDLLRARKEGRPALGQRPPPELPAPADGAHDQHLPARRRPTTPTTSWPSTDKGVYVAHLGGGQVNTATGDFVFGMTEAYLIEDGEITEPLREGNLIGNGPEVLTRIDAVGNDFAMGPPGTCGKDGQGVPVGDGVPTLRVSSLTVGGTAA